MTTKPGEVYLVDLGMAAKVRPMLIVSRADADAPRALSICAPITTKSRGSEYEIPVGKPHFLKEESFVNVQGLQAIQHHELHRKLGTLKEPEMREVKAALEWIFEIG